MENNIFIYNSRNNLKIEFQRFHICTWEFRNNTSIIEIGGEILNKNFEDIIELEFSIFFPWINSKLKVNDLYDKLKEPENSRFIFNDSVSASEYLDEGQKKKGVIQKFVDREKLCILPISTKISNDEKSVTISINLKPLKSIKNWKNNIYFRFFIEPKTNFLSTRKTGISHSTIIYDFKVNEKRNLPNQPTIDLQEKELCPINTCFFFNIIPNSYELNFFDNTALKNIRTLEYDSFKKYMGDSRVKKDELVVVFHKKKEQESYSFFAVYSKERIGAGQFALAVLVSLFSGILLFMPTYKHNSSLGYFSKEFWLNLPFEVYTSLAIGLLVIVYFLWPKINFTVQKLFSLINFKGKNK
jgi:hypothetical protein